MVRAISLPYYFNKKHQRDEKDIIENLAVSVRKNYSTFDNWAAVGKKSSMKTTITGRLAENFATFREWGK
ncbi:MAG: hypothetical protein ACYDEQ_14225 [Desulfocucumaceae bacterium]